MPPRVSWEILLFGQYESSYELLYDLYVNQYMSMEEIAEKLGVSYMVVRNEMQRLGLPIRPKGRPRFLTKIKINIKRSIKYDLR